METEELQEHIINKEKTGQPCEQILGGLANVEEFAAFWRKNKRIIKTAKAGLLLDFCEVMSFTDTEYRHYRLGVEAMLKLFKDSEIEIETRRKLEQQKQAQKR